MIYFHGSFNDLHNAFEEVWRREDTDNVPRSKFSLAAVGSDASVWTESRKGEALFRKILLERGIKFEENNTR